MIHGDPDAVPLYAAVLLAEKPLHDPAFVVACRKRFPNMNEAIPATILNEEADKLRPFCCHYGDAEIAKITRKSRNAPADMRAKHEELVARQKEAAPK